MKIFCEKFSSLPKIRYLCNQVLANRCKQRMFLGMIPWVQGAGMTFVGK